MAAETLGIRFFFELNSQTYKICLAYSVALLCLHQRFVDRDYNIIAERILSKHVFFENCLFRFAMLDLYD